MPTKTKLVIFFGAVLAAMFFAPVLALAQTGACGEAASYFYYPQKILFNPANDYLYVLSARGLITVLDEKSLSVVKKLAPPVLSYDFALNSKTGRLYVLGDRPGRISVYDALSFDNLSTVLIEKNYNPNNPILKSALVQVAVDENTDKLYILDRAGTKFLTVNGADNTLEKEYIIPYSVNFWPDFKSQKIYLWGGSSFIRELDLKTGKVNPFPVGQYPRDAYVDAAGGRVIFVDSQLDSLFAISGQTGKVVKKIDLGLVNPRFVAASEKLSLIAVSGIENKINFYDLKNYSLLKSVILPENSQPERVFFDDAGKLAYVPNFISSVISVIDIKSFNIVRNAPSGILPDNAFFNSKFLSKEGLVTPGGNFYLTYPYSQSISRLTPDGQVAFVGGYSKNDPLLRYCPADDPVFAGPNFMAFNSDQSKVYVANRGRFITILDAKKDSPLGKIDLDGAATRLIYDKKLDRLIAARATDSLVSIFDGKTGKLLANVKTGVRPVGLLANNYNGDVYVFNALNDFLTVIHPDFSASKIALDSLPVDFIYDESSGRLFVSTQNSAAVIDVRSGNTAKSFPELKKTYIAAAGNNIIFSSAFDNYFTAVNVQTIESRKIGFDNPAWFAYHGPSGKLFVLDLYGAKIEVFDSNLKSIGAIPSGNPFRNFGTSFLTASDKFIYLLDSSNKMLQIVDPADYRIKTMALNYGPYDRGINISNWLVDKQNEKLYIASNPYPQVTVLYLADLSKFSAKAIYGNFPPSFWTTLKNNWPAVAIAFLIVMLLIAVLLAYNFWQNKKAGNLPVQKQ